jgi:uncharacterized tellurite resistance protein B-like protein
MLALHFNKYLVQKTHRLLDALAFALKLKTITVDCTSNFQGGNMGLLIDITDKKIPVKQPTDDVLLVLAIMNMIYADGSMDVSEATMLESFYQTLPEFAGKDFTSLLNQAKTIVQKYETIHESTAALKDLSSAELKKKAFVCAVDLALASGDVGKAEDELLEAMQRVLEIDLNFAKQAIEVMSTKYAA